MRTTVIFMACLQCTTHHIEFYSVRDDSDRQTFVRFVNLGQAKKYPAFVLVKRIERRRDGGGMRRGIENDT